MQGWDPEDAKAWDRHFGTETTTDFVLDWLFAVCGGVVVIVFCLGIWKALELVGIA